MSRIFRIGFMKRALVTFGLIALMVSTLTTPSSAGQPIRVVSGVVQDTNGNPIPNFEGGLSSIGGLYATFKTDSQGKFRVQARNGQVTLWSHWNWLQVNAPFTLESSNNLLTLVTPPLKSFSITVTDSVGNPVSNIQVDQMGTGEFARVVQVDESVVSFSSSGNPNGAVTNQSGVAAWKSFDYSSTYSPDDLDGDSIPDGLVAYYYPLENVNLSITVPFSQWKDGKESIELPEVPTIQASSPSSVRKDSTFTISSVVTKAPAQASSLSLGTKSSTFKNKKAELWARTYTSPSKPGVWKKIATVKIDKYGKAKFKVKQKTKKQYQIRLSNISSSSKLMVVKIK